MSYMRGTFYAWVGSRADSNVVAINEAGAHLKQEYECPACRKGKCEEHDYIMINDLELPLKIFDQLVVMRYAELQEEGMVEEVERFTVEEQKGNFGSFALQRKFNIDPVQDLKDFLDRIVEEKSKAHGK